MSDMIVLTQRDLRIHRQKRATSGQGHWQLIRL